MKQKHYMDIQHLSTSFADGFEKGDHIIIQEKIDGANFSIRYDSEDNTVKSFSRKNQLSLLNDLRGAWQWAEKLDVDLVKSVLGENLILFGEWLVSHTVKYPQDRYEKAYFYDVYDINHTSWLPQSKVKDIIEKLGLMYVPVLYDGEFTSWDDVRQYIGKTELGGDYGEGIVVKNQTKLNSENNRFPFYAKLVGENFRETKHSGKPKVVDFEKLELMERLRAEVETVVTDARVRKLIHKMVDDGLLPEDWRETDMPIIARNIGQAVYYDCVKEAPDVVESVGALFGKIAQSTAMKIAREILSERIQYIM